MHAPSIFLFATPNNSILETILTENPLKSYNVTTILVVSKFQDSISKIKKYSRKGLIIRIFHLLEKGSDEGDMNKFYST